MQVDRASAPLAVSQILRDAGAEVVWKSCILPKACKNPVEIAGAAEAHLRDGAAVVEFLTWFDLTAPGGGLTEMDVVTALEGHRRATNELREISFDTICGSGPHGAVIHYRVTKGTNRAIPAGRHRGDRFRWAICRWHDRYHPNGGGGSGAG